MTCRENKVQFGVGTWIGLATLTLTIIASCLTGASYMRSSDVMRIEKLETDREKQEERMLQITISLTEVSTIVAQMQEREKAILQELREQKTRTP